MHFFTVKWVKKPTGKRLALVNDYTFSCNGPKKSANKWTCCVGTKCKAKFIINNNRDIIRSHLVHNHPAPKYTVFNGIFLKL